MTDPDRKPRRHLGLIDATAVFAGIILGSGIFVAPSGIAAVAPSPARAVALWIAGALVAACGASCYAECAGRVPANGGFFVFQREAFGRAIAFVSGWAAIFVTYPASIAAISLVCAAYLSQCTGTAVNEPLVGALALAAAGLLNVVGLRTGPRAQVVLTSIKIAVLAIVALAALSGTPHPAAAAVVAAPDLPSGATAWLSALMILLWTYDGWSDVTLVAGEVRSPGRNLGRAVILGTAVLALVYSLTQFAVMRALPRSEIVASTRPVAAAVESLWGARAGSAVAGLVVVSTFGSIVGTVLTVSRLGHAMAREGAFFPGIGTLHPRWATPARSTAVLTGMAIVYALWGSFRGILALFTFAVWIFYGLTAIALLILRRRGVGEPATWRAPLGVVPPIVVLTVAVAMTIELVMDDPLRAAGGAALLCAAFPVYGFIARSGARRR